MRGDRMRQQVTLGYFERDEAGRMRACSRAVIVEAESGDEAAAKALAEHGAALERLSGYDPGQTAGRVAVLGVTVASDRQNPDVRSQKSEARSQKVEEKTSSEAADRSKRKSQARRARQ